ncbi:hypothetical protein PHMEG_00014938 [Phytophthora megakarya]|uniref:WW domain-containing protein n=1 Tax=Phytophthora megakarya TaxID=4795 RepID=A0A225W4K8_9STRA|nr:hypothetical protein PHMEG_00014938 [Phytophthora megakarya]
MTKEEDSVASREIPNEAGSEWSSSRRSGRQVRTAANRPNTDDSELRVDTKSKEEVKQAEEENTALHKKEELHEAGRGQSSTGSEHSDQLEEPIIPVTVLTTMEAETKTTSTKTSGFVTAEHAAEKDEGEETEDDIALLEYLSGTESDYYELDRASRKGDDADNPTPIMSLSPRSYDESLGTPGSPGGLLSVDEHGGFGKSSIHFMTVTRRMMAHAQEAPRQATTGLVESTPNSGDSQQESENTEAKETGIVPRPPIQTRETTSEAENEWIPCQTEDGLTYYYNQRTQESQWTIPAAASVRPNTVDELFTVVACEELSETDSRQLSIMLHSGMDLQAVNSDGLTPLHVACKAGNEKAAALLIYYGAKLDARAVRDDATPLILACQAESEEIAKLLVESSASISACDSNGSTALHVAVDTGNEGVVMFVLRGCDQALLRQKNNEGETALHIAAKLGYFGIVRSLLAYGASAKDEDSQGRTPLILSILENHVECVQLLQNVESNSSPEKPATTSYYGSAYPNDRRQGSGAERDALTVLHSYLFQILSNHPASESQTVYQLVEEVRGQIGALTATLQASNGRETHYRAQVEETSSNLTAKGEELKKEQALHADTQNLLAVRELELDASRVSHRALSSRCELLESIARNAQEKLGRERSEHTRYEESMQEKLHVSLQENAKVIESCRQLQAQWNERQQQQQYDPRLGRRDSQGFYEISDDLARLSSVQESIGENYHLLETEASTSIASSNQPRERTSNDYQRQQQYDGYQNSFAYQYENVPEDMDMPPPLLDDPDEVGDKETITPPISPSRVGAVLERFFENVGYASETRDSKAYNPSSFQAEQPSLTYPSNSLVFDSVRKNELRKLQDILLRGVSPNQRDVAEKGTPLHLACELGDIDSVMLLAEFAADLEARDEAGNTPLLVACFQGNFECVKFLLQSAVSLLAVNENGDSALHLAAWDGSIQCVMILLEYGVDPMATNRFGLTALGNMKTRSPMRHKFDDMPEDHPMCRTLVVLEEAERQRSQVIEDKSTSTEDANEHQVPLKPETPNSSAKRGETNTSTTTVTEDYDGDSDDVDDFASYEDSRLITETKYEPLTPPPEIEEALRRAKASQKDVYEPPSPASVPTYPMPRQDSKPIKLSPSVRNPSKPHPPPPPSNIRARYVDTFNSP